MPPLGDMRMRSTKRSYEINRISDVTEFNGIALGNADKTLNVQVGIGSSSTNDVIGISLEDFDATALALQADISSTTNAGTALDKLDTAIDSVNSLRSGFGAVQNRLNPHSTI